MTMYSNINSSNYIDLESSIKATSDNVILLDNVSDYYILEDTLVSGFSFLSKYDNILKSGLSDYTLKSEYKYRPEYVSNEIFNTPDLWYVILYVNNMSSVMEFNKDIIKVPLSNTIDVINKLINYEKDLAYSIQNPKPIKRNLLKSLKSDSDRVLNDYYNDKINPYKNNELISKKDYLINNNYLKKEIIFNKKGVIDENNNDITAFKPFTIENIVSFPSCKFKDGINKKYYTGIRLDSNNIYDFLFIENGITKIKLYNGSDQINLEKKFIPGKPKLIYDFRESNLDKLEYYDDSITLNFNNSNGKFNLEYNSEISLDEIKLFNIVIDKNDIDRLDLTRLKREDCLSDPIIENINDPGISEEIIGHDNHNIVYNYYDYLFITLEYSSLYDINSIKNNGFSVKINYLDETYEIYENDLSNSEYCKYYNTLDEISKLTLPIQLNPNKKESIKSIEVYSKIYRTKTINTNVKYNVYGFEISGYLNENFKEEFIPKNSGYYNIEIDYKYTKPFDEYVGGLLFDIKLRKNNKILSPVYYDINTPLNTNINFNGIFKENCLNKVTYLNTNNTIKLPNDYILNFKINLDESNDIGSIGILFDSKFDSKDNLLGYLLIISNNPNIPTDLDISNDSDYSIMRTGLYKLDPYKINEGNKTYKYILDNDNIYLNAVLIESFSNDILNNKDLKLIKRLNRISLFDKNNENNWKYDNPLVPFIQDNDNYYYNNGIGFISLLHSNENLKSNIEILDYFTYKL